MWKYLQTILWQWRGLAIAPSVAGIIVGLRALGLLQPLELAALDQFFRWRPIAAVDDRIVIVGINEADLKRVQQFPITDGLLAQLLEKIRQQQPLIIGLDLYRNFPVEPGHQQLVQVLRSTPNLIGIRKAISDSTGAVIAAPPELAKLGQVGANDMVLDADGKIRRMLLSLKDEQNELVQTLGTTLALAYLQAEGVNIESLDDGRIKLGSVTLSAFQSNDGGYSRADAGGFQLIANFHSLRQGFPMVSLTDVLDDRIPKQMLRDRIVLIGMVAESAKDFVFTPFTDNNDKRNYQTPGVSIHAEVASQLIATVLDDHPLIKVWPKPLESVWILAWALVGTIICWGNRYRNANHAPSRWLAQVPGALLLLLLLGMGLVGGGYVLSLQGWWLPTVPSVLALAMGAIATTAYTARSAAEMRQVFGRYLTDEVVSTLLEKPGGFQIASEWVKVTILMSDLRGFSAISEQVSTEKAVTIINAYLETMTDVVQQYQGTINEFIGDGLMVMFGTPIQAEDDAQRAVACGIAMQLAMLEVNQRHFEMGLPPLEMGIGINTGEVLAGNIGSAKRAKYTIIGSPVNLASRIESYTVGGQVLISAATYQAVGKAVRLDNQIDVHLKGMREPTVIYQVGGIGHPFNLTLPVQDDGMVTLKQSIPVDCLVLLGKQIDNQAIPGQFVKLSLHTAELQLPQALDIWTNLKLTLLAGRRKIVGLGDLYAKVMARSPDQEPNTWSYIICFTAIPPEVAALFHYLKDLA